MTLVYLLFCAVAVLPLGVLGYHAIRLSNDPILGWPQRLLLGVVGIAAILALLVVLVGKSLLASPVLQGTGRASKNVHDWIGGD